MFAAPRFVLPVLLPCLALAASGCGKKTVNPKGAEDLVRRGLAAAHAGPAKSVDCPSGVEAKVGKTFTCHATLRRGGSITFTLRVDTVSGSSGHVTIVGAHQP